ncbi:hypothetical protein MCAMS1_02298 [biofilm metagenome]
MINKYKLHFPKAVLLMMALFLVSFTATALPKIAVLDYELRDLTVLPGVPQEIARTASVKTMLEEQLSKAGYGIVSIPREAQAQATAGFGYLFDHHDVAAKLGQQYNADYVLVGRLHKPSFLFVYLMAHLVDVKKQVLIADYLSEVKGGDKKLTGKGVEDLVVKINKTFKDLQ